MKDAEADRICDVLCSYFACVILVCHVILMALDK